MNLPGKIVFLFIINSVLTYETDYFTEELLLKPLYGDQLYAHFQFTTKWDTELSSENCKFAEKSNITHNFIYFQSIILAYFQEH